MHNNIIMIKRNSTLSTTSGYYSPRGVEVFLKVTKYWRDDDTMVIIANKPVGKSVFEIDYFYIIDDESILSDPLDPLEIEQLDQTTYKFVFPLPNDFITQDPIVLREGLILTSNGCIAFSPRKVRAHYDDESIYVYQAFNTEIVSQAVENQQFGDKFNFDRNMTWIKPSFTWMMHRVNWLQKDDDNRVIRIRIRNSFFYDMLRRSTLSSQPKNGYYYDKDLYQADKIQNPNRVQWDPEWTLQGERFDDIRAIQLGIHKSFYASYNANIISIIDISPEVLDLATQLEQNKNITDRLLPEYPFHVPLDIEARLDMIEEIPY